ncbi:DUF5682 family protein [Massilia niabensis]|uniref:DUF5682 family protein n=1 Tax=Massilia niabensis TaxID=544910 RepID=A0ABW0L3U7_9BURK
MNAGAPAGTLPPQVREGLARMEMDGVHFAPVRHHSPACALALQAMVRELRPAAILVEGPDSFDALLPLLHDERTRPPVAILSQADGAAGMRSAFFPFCDYSPEWVALRLARESGAEFAFIDLAWQARGADDGEDDGEDAAVDEQARSLMAERYLAHSAYLAALARASGCRSQDELWDHLFELRPPSALRDWRTLFGDIFAYCALARTDYEAEVLEADGSLARERHMANHVRRRHSALRAAGNSGAIVVVSGGFHTLALQQMLAAPAPAPAPGQHGRAAGAGDWLIRYSFDRLDALNGYAAGMTSPAWHQWVWDSAQAGPEGPHLDRVAADALARFARQGRERGLLQLSTADVQAGVLQALRLAALRGHAGPGREDVLDALRSCFVKDAIDEGTAGLAQDLRSFLGGTALGDIPPSAGSPPLLEDARRRALAQRVRLDDSAPRTVRLDLYRKEGHRVRSRFLHLMDYLGTGLGRWQGGPDFLAGIRLELLVEEWTVAWTPLVEARLIELATDGATLPEVALARLRREEAALADQGQGRCAGAAVKLLTRACLVGLQPRLPHLLDLLARHLAEDPDIASVTSCAHQLLSLWRAREPLGVQDDAGVHALLQLAWASSLALLPGLAAVKPEQEAAAVRTLIDLRAIGLALADPAQEEAWTTALGRLAAAPGVPGIGLAAGALLFLGGAWSGAQLTSVLGAHFGPGAEPGGAVRALGGLMAAAPELLLTQPGLQADLDRIMAGWDEAAFLAYLPDLRLAFAQLKPPETARLAEALARTHAGLDEALSTVQYGMSEDDMAAGAALQAALAQCLARDGLSEWADEWLAGAAP